MKHTNSCINIIVLNNAYPTKHAPKKGSAVQSICESLKLNKVHVDLLVMKSDHTNRLQLLFNYLKYYLEVLRFNKFHHYDVVLVHHYAHCALPLLLKFRQIKHLVLHWHGEDMQTRNPVRKVVYSLLYKLLPGRAYHIAPSEYFAGIVASKLNLSPSKVAAIPSGGVDVQLFKPDRKHNVTGEVHIGFASGFYYEKGIDRVINLLAKIDQLNKPLEQVVFHYIDYGTDYRQEFEKISVDLKVKPWKPMLKNAMPAFYNGIDILLFPTRRESLGLAALEAMSCGIPVVGTDDFALREYIIPGKTGERFEPDSARNLLSALNECILKYDQYAPRTFIMERYSMMSAGRKYKKMFENIVHR